jgi:hypothetical protein
LLENFHNIYISGLVESTAVNVHKIIALSRLNLSNIGRTGIDFLYKTQFFYYYVDSAFKAPLFISLKSIKRILMLAFSDNVCFESVPK